MHRLHRLWEAPTAKNHLVHTHRSAEDFPRAEHLARRIAEVAADPVQVGPETEEMIVNRIIDNAAVAAASLTRRPVANARAQALAHPYRPGSTMFGVEGRYSPEWAAWANGVTVRELDFHDTFLAAEYSHPGDNIPPILAVDQHAGCSGHDLIRGLATGYEIQVDLVRAICLHEHKIDHVAHLGPSAAAGIGTLLGWTPRRSIRPCSRRFTSPPPRGNRARARFRAGRPMPRRSRARWRLKPLTA